jgi:hypothetical protein
MKNGNSWMNFMHDDVGDDVRNVIHDTIIIEHNFTYMHIICPCVITSNHTNKDYPMDHNLQQHQIMEK